MKEVSLAKNFEELSLSSAFFPLTKPEKLSGAHFPLNSVGVQWLDLLNGLIVFEFNFLYFFSLNFANHT